MHIEVNDNVEQYKKKRGNFTNDLSVCKEEKTEKVIVPTCSIIEYCYVR